MAKISLRHYVGKSIPLIWGGEIYAGKVVEKRRESRVNSLYNQKEYFFQTDEGEMISIGKRNISLEADGLALRLNTLRVETITV